MVTRLNFDGILTRKNILEIGFSAERRAGSLRQRQLSTCLITWGLWSKVTPLYRCNLAEDRARMQTDANACNAGEEAEIDFRA